MAQVMIRKAHQESAVQRLEKIEKIATTVEERAFYHLLSQCGAEVVTLFW